MIADIALAQRELDAAERDAIADFGEDAVDGAWSDLVQSVTSRCTEEVGRELARMQGVDYRPI